MGFQEIEVLGICFFFLVHILWKCFYFRKPSLNYMTNLLFFHHYLVVHSCQRLVAARPWDWPFFDTAFKANCGKASLVIGGNGWLIQKEANIRITRTNRPSFSGIFNILLNRNICLKNRQRVFEQVGQEITFVSSGSKHVFNRSCHWRTYQNITSNI